MTNKIKFPEELLKPVKGFLESQLNLLNVRMKDIESEDPFSNPDRVLDNAAIDTEAEEQFGHDMATALKYQIKEKIEQTKSAIDRIEKGDYGYCSNCGNMINTDRLMIYPEATYCVSCIEKQESK